MSAVAILLLLAALLLLAGAASLVVACFPPSTIGLLERLPPGSGAKGEGFEIQEAEGILFLRENDLPCQSFFDSSDRDTIVLDGPWRFRLDPEDRGLRDGWQVSDTADWQCVDLPSTFNAASSPWADYHGIAWYARDFEIPEIAGGRLARLVFDGVLMRCEIWLNGRRLGSREGGYSSFAFDAGPAARSGVNSIALRVDDRLTPSSLPPLNRPGMRPGWFAYGGVYRGVRLEILPFPYVFKAAASCRLAAGSADLSVEVLVHAFRAGASDSPGAYELSCILHGPGGRPLGERRASGLADREILAHFFSFAIESPSLYSCESPALYECSLKISSTAGTDAVYFKTGIRSVEVRGERLEINGEPVFLKGVCKHEDDPLLGATQDKAATARDIALLRGLGANYARLAHYPHDARAVAAARDAGMYLGEEIANYQAGMGFVHWFAQGDGLRSFPVRDFGLRQVLDRRYLLACQRELAELVERDRNNPAVILWGLGNETYDLGRAGRKAYAWLRSVVRALDASRPVTMCEQTYDRPLFDSARRGCAATDLVSVNLYSGWYYGESAEAAGHLDRVRALFPGKPVIVSEFGADAAPGRHDSDGVWIAERVAPGKTYSEEYQAELLRRYWEIARSRPWVAGVSAWVLADYRCTWFPGNPVPNYNLKGLVSADRTPKLGYFALSGLFRGEGDA